MHVVQHSRRHYPRRSMHGVLDRRVVSGDGLGDLEGINLGKMFKRMFTFTSSSFKLKNIAGAIGSVAATTATMGLAPLIAPKFVSAHSKTMQHLGYGIGAAAVAVGVGYGGSALLSSVKGVGSVASTGTGLVGTAAKSAGFVHPVTGAAAVAGGGGILSNVGSALSTVWTGIKAIGSALPIIGQVGQVLGGGGGGQQQQTDPNADAYYQQQQQQAAAQEAANRQAQAEYDAYVRAQQQQMYVPGGMPGGMPVSYEQQPTMAAYGDLRSPYTAIAENGEQVQIDPATGQIIQPGMSTEMMIALGAVTLGLGVYFMSGNSKNN